MIATTGARNSQQQRRDAGHFAGISFQSDNINFAKWPYRLNATTPTSIATDLAHTEATLAARAHTPGFVIKRGYGVENFAHSDDTVTVRAGGETFQATWIIGRDGKGLLLYFDARPELQTLAHRWRDRVTYVAGDANERLGLSAVLVRPDGFVAWPCDGEPNVDDGARVAARWFGEQDASV